MDRSADPSDSLLQQRKKNVRVLTDKRSAPFLRMTDGAVSDFFQTDGAVSDYHQTDGAVGYSFER